MSAVARLNDEVDQLKRKLAQRADGSIDGEERGMIVTRYESQIHEIELMLRQTWEDKARMSEVHDKAREVRIPIRGVTVARGWCAWRCGLPVISSLNEGAAES